MPRSSSEPDVSTDSHLAGSRETGGEHDEHPDQQVTDDGGTTTGTDENEEFVGRVAGQDAGYAGETGAEARAEQQRTEPGSDRPTTQN
jgi:hypothetical protein